MERGFLWRNVQIGGLKRGKRGVLRRWLGGKTRRKECLGILFVVVGKEKDLPRRRACALEGKSCSRVGGELVKGPAVVLTFATEGDGNSRYAERRCGELLLGEKGGSYEEFFKHFQDAEGGRVEIS